MKSYTVRLFPTNEQIDEFNKLSLIRNKLWNILVDIQNKEYETNKNVFHNYELDKKVTLIRKENNFELLFVRACQQITKEIFSSYKSFFKLIKKDKKAKPPTFIENVDNFHTIVYNNLGYKINNDSELTINGIKVKYKSHLPLKDYKIIEVKLKFINKKWLLDIVINDNPLKNENLSDNTLAIDLGLKCLGTGIDNNRNIITIKNKAKKITKYYKKQIGKVQQKLATKTKDSNRYNHLRKVLNLLYHKKNKQIKQTLHIQSNELLNMNYKTIVVGDLSVKKLMQVEKNKFNKISKSFHDSNVAMFVDMLIYKSYFYGTEIIKINEHNTTQMNSLTGELFKEKVKLSDRLVKLNDEIEIDRDLNSAINILNKYFNKQIGEITHPLVYSNVIENYNFSMNQYI